MKRVQLGAGKEFDLIRRFVYAGAGDDVAVGPGDDIAVGPGDDAAVLRDGWVVTTDLSVEGVHFRREWLTDEEVGWRAAAVALSDLAARAATPVAVLVSMAVPTTEGGDSVSGGVDVEAVQRGVRAASSSVGAVVVGGDLTRSPGPLFVDVVALGRTAWPVQRDGAEAGDHVWVTGTLGAAAAAVTLWEAGDQPPEPLRRAFAHPEPRVEAARCLVEQEVVDALIDLSDGLAGDAGHLAAASGVTVILEEDTLPVEPAVVDTLGAERARELALFGGDDYELCFVTDPGVVDPEYFRRKYGLQLTRVGTVIPATEDGPGVRLRGADGVVRSLHRSGFDHWGTD
ncbi:MAG: thiamine-phosphate kinase [Longimicrobiales bacterium]|nr:thiamine-phosphate kinase [Longimicrobiales bacterium]